MKYTVSKLKDLARRREKLREELDKVNSKLVKHCTHPKSVMLTQTQYHTDDSGQHGSATYHDFCSLCGCYTGDYYSCSAAKGEKPHYKLKES